MSVDRNQLDRQTELSVAVGELDALTRGSTLNATQRLRVQALLSKISFLKAGGSVDEYLRAEGNKRRLRDGLQPMEFSERKLSPDMRAFWLALKGQEDSREFRDLLENNPQLGAINSAGGSFVPLEFWEQVVEGLAQLDPLLDADNVTLRKTEGLVTRPIQVPGWDLTAIEAVQVSEGSSQSPQVEPTASGKLLGGYMFRTSLAASFEIAEDAFQSLSVLLARAYAVGFARGIGKKLINGSGSGQPQGLLTAAANSGYTTGSASLLTLTDLLSVYFAINRIHRSSEKCAWVVGDKTYQKIRAAVDDNHRPLLDVERDGEYLLGKKVLVSPSMPDSAGSKAIVFGDLGHFLVRLSSLSIQRSINEVGAVEKGMAVYHGRMRADSSLFDPSASTPPIVYATLHS